MERQAEDVMDIDRALERAMDADDPGPAFAGRVVAAIKREQAAAGLATGPVPAATRPGRSGVMWRAMLPLAATVALTAGTVQWRTSRAEEARAAQARLEHAQARAAQAQLVQALRLTGETLNVVHRAIERSQE
jgi:hypothetical protein